VHAAAHLGYPSLRAVVEAPPTAELRPLKGGEIEQTDEEDMGMTYDELGVFGRLRKVPAVPAPRAPTLCALRLPRSLAPLSPPRQIEHCGPVSMFQKLLSRWQGCCSAAEVAAKVHALPPDETRLPNH
jgi:NAD+ synthase (glutamine-hydrolysing)